MLMRWKLSTKNKERKSERDESSSTTYFLTIIQQIILQKFLLMEVYILTLISIEDIKENITTVHCSIYLIEIDNGCIIYL
jgi:hypothetical protein